MTRDFKTAQPVFVYQEAHGICLSQDSGHDQTNDELIQARGRRIAPSAISGWYQPPRTGADTILTDTQTGLMWTTKTCGPSLDWHAALAWVAAMNAACYFDFNDWRLPNVKELADLKCRLPPRFPEKSANFLTVTLSKNKDRQAATEISDIPTATATTTHIPPPRSANDTSMPDQKLTVLPADHGQSGDRPSAGQAFDSKPIHLGVQLDEMRPTTPLRRVFSDVPLVRNLR